LLGIVAELAFEQLERVLVLRHLLEKAAEEERRETAIVNAGGLVYGIRIA
jgi:hypothetical protein